MAREFQPTGSLPPNEWKNGKGRQSFERVWPAAALTLYVKVRPSILLVADCSRSRMSDHREECGFALAGLNRSWCSVRFSYLPSIPSDFSCVIDMDTMAGALVFG